MTIGMIHAPLSKNNNADTALTKKRFLLTDRSLKTRALYLSSTVLRPCDHVIDPCLNACFIWLRC